jgi:hypothetical protein
VPPVACRLMATHEIDPSAVIKALRARLDDARRFL